MSRQPRASITQETAEATANVRRCDECFGHDTDKLAPAKVATSSDTRVEAQIAKDLRQQPGHLAGKKSAERRVFQDSELQDKTARPASKVHLRASQPTVQVNRAGPRREAQKPKRTGRGESEISRPEVALETGMNVSPKQVSICSNTHPDLVRSRFFSPLQSWRRSPLGSIKSTKGRFPESVDIASTNPPLTRDNCLKYTPWYCGDEQEFSDEDMATESNVAGQTEL